VPCRDRFREYARGRTGTYKKRRSAGLCPWCGADAEPGRVFCEPCAERNREVSAKWYEKRREKVLARWRERYASDPEYRALMQHKARRSGTRDRRVLRAKVIEAYGGRCVCCGFADVRALDLDHVTRDGPSNRRPPYAAYREAIKEAYPDRFRLLCRNCNWGAFLGEGDCTLLH
jgi:hypothetical protein